MICQECKDCWNYKVCEIGCYGSDKPCEYYTGENKEEVYQDFDCNDVLPSDETIGIIQYYITELKMKGK